MDGYRFNSDIFQIEPDEDEEINPRIYGRQLAVWLKGQLEQRGYSVEPIINEDWGRCLMCSRNPYMLWVGCGSAPDYATAMPGDPPPTATDVEWHCFAKAEPTLVQRWFRRMDGAGAQAKLALVLQEILLSEPRVRLLGAQDSAP